MFGLGYEGGGSKFYCSDIMIYPLLISFFNFSLDFKEKI